MPARLQPVRRGRVLARFGLFGAGAGPGMRPAAGVLALLLLASVLAVVPVSPAGAQTPPPVECSSANDDGSYTVPADWALKPSAIAAGHKFRLLFLTTTTRKAAATDIGDYNSFVQTRAKAGHAAISDSCGDLFKAVGSTEAVDARDNTSTTGAGEPIYWLGGAKLADDYADFYDGTWDDYTTYAEAGTEHTILTYSKEAWTGSNNDGTKHSKHFLGNTALESDNTGPNVRVGVAAFGFSPLSNLSLWAGTSTNVRHLYGLSPVFAVEEPNTGPDDFVYALLGPVGSGFVAENGGTGTFEVFLSEAVAAGDSVEVPLVFSVPPADPADPQPGETPGSATRGTDYSLACETPLPAGVTCSLSGASPKVTFGPGSGGEGSDAVRVTLTGTADSADEGTETVTVALGEISGVSGSGGALFFLTEVGVTLTPGASRAWSRPGFDYAVSVIEGGGDDASATYSLVLDSDPGETVTVSIDVRSKPSFKVLQNLYVSTFTPGPSGNWNVPQEVTLQAADDADSDAASALVTHSVTVADSDGPYHGLSVPGVAVSVIDDEAEPSVSVTGGADVDEGDSAIFTFTAAPAPATDITVAFRSFQIGDVVNPAVLGTGSVLIPAGMSSVEVTFPTVGDTAAEDDGTVLVSLDPPGQSAGYSIAPPTAAQVDVLDDDGDPDPVPDPQAVLSITAGADVVEGTAGEFVVTAAPAGTVHPVSYWRDPAVGSRGFTSNYGPTRTGLLSNPAWASRFVEGGSRIVTLRASGDSRDEPSQLAILRVAHRNHSGVEATDQLLVLDDDPTTVTLSGSGGSVDEDAGSSSFTVDLGRALRAPPDRRGSPTPEVLAVPLVLGGTAAAGLDYTLSCAAAAGVTCSGLATANPVVTFTGSADGSAMSVALTLTAVDDVYNEGASETVTVALGTLNSQSGVNLHGGASGSGSASLTITDDDDGAAQPLVSIEGPSGVVQEGKNAVFTVSIPTALSKNLWVNLHVDDAALPGDFIGDPEAETLEDRRGVEGDQRVRIRKGNTSATFRVPIHDDDVLEKQGEITVTVRPSQTDYAIHSEDSSASATVAKSDSKKVSFSEWTYDVEEGGTAELVVELDSGTTSIEVPVQVRLKNSDAARHGEDFSGPMLLRGTIPPGGSQVAFTVPIIDDTEDEDDETFTASLLKSGLPEGVSRGSPVNAVIDITDNDEAGTSVVSIAKGADVTEGAAATFTVKATPPPAQPLTVSVAVTESGSFISGTKPTTVTVGTSGSATLSVNTQNDGTDEANGSITATLGAGAGYNVAAAPNNAATVAVADNDTPVVSIAKGADVAEGNAATFTVAANPAPYQPLTVNVTVSESGSFIAGTKPTTVTVGTSGTATLSVNTQNDNANEADGSVTATLADGTGYTVAAAPNNAATVAVSDNDVPVVRITKGADVAEGAAATFTVNASPAPAQPITVNVSVTESGAFISGTAPTTVTVGTTGSATLSVNTNNDSVDEDDGSVTATLGAGAGYNLHGTASLRTATVNVSDNDVPVISIARVGTTVAEAAGANAVFRLESNIAIARALDVSVTVTEAAGSDFVAAGDQGSQTAVFAADLTSPYRFTYQVPITNDTVDEADGSVTATVVTGTGYTVAASPANSSTIAVTDDDLPVVSIAGPAGNIAEGASATFTVGVGRAQSAALTVLLHVDDAASPRDFVAGTAEGDKMVVIPAGSTSVSYAVAITQDNVLEDAGTISVNIRTSATTYRRGTHTATASVAQNDTKQVQFSAGSYSSTEGQMATLTVQLNNGTTSKAIPVTVNLADVTAVRGSDYTGAATRTVTIPAGGSSGTLQILAADDSVDEPDQTYTAQIQTAGLASGVTRGSQHTATVTIVDNDVPTVSVTAAAATVTEGAANARARFTVSSDIALEHALTVRLTIADVTGSDFIAAGAQGTKNVVLPVSATAPVTRVHEVAIQNDNVDELDGSVTATLAAGTTSTYTIASAPANAASVLVQDDEVPKISITAGSSAVTEGSNAGFTLHADIAPAVGLSVNVAVADDHAWSDFVAEQTHTVTLSAGATSKAFNVPTKADSADEANGSFTATVQTGTNYEPAAGAAKMAKRSVADDDLTLVALTDATLGDLTEGGTRAYSLTIPRALRPGETLTVPISHFTLAGHAARGIDWTLACPAVPPAGVTCGNLDVQNGAVTFTGSTSGSATAVTLTLTAVADGLAETGGELVNLGFGTITATGMGGGTGRDDSAPQLRILDPVGNQANLTAPAMVAEGASVQVTVTLTQGNTTGSALQIPVQVRTGDSTAAPGDYTLASSTVTIAAGASSGSVALSATDDSADEPSETVVVELGSSLPSGISPGGATVTTITIADLDATGVTLSAPTGPIEEAGEAKAITVALGRALVSPEALTVPLALGGAATVGADYTLACPSPLPANVSCAGLGTASPSVTFTGPSAVSVVLTLTATDDSLDEGDSEQVTVTLGTLNASSGTNLGGGASGSGSASFAITDDDTPEAGSAVFAPTALQRTEGENATYTVALSKAPTHPVTVAVSLIGPPGLVSLLGTPVTFTPSNWSIPKTLTVQIADDDIDQAANRTVTINHSGTSTDPAFSGALGSLVVTVVDNDGAGVTISKQSVSVTEAAGASHTAAYTVVLDSQPTHAVTINLALDSTVATVSAPSLTFQPAAWDTPKTVTVTAVDDDIDQPADRTTTITHTASSSDSDYTGSYGSVAVTVVDDDVEVNPSVVTVTAGGPVTEGDAATFTLTANPAPTSPLTVNVRLHDAPGASDFLAAGVQGDRTVTIPISGAKTFTVTTSPDQTSEPDGDIRAVIRPGAGYILGSPASASVRVADDDGVALSISDASGPEGEFMRFAVTLSRPAAQRLVVDYQVVSDPDAVRAATLAGRSGADVTTLGGAAYFDPGETVEHVVVYVRKDRFKEPAETFGVQISIASGGGGVAVADSFAVGTIGLPDSTPRVVVDSTVLAVFNGDTAAYRVRLNSRPSGTVTVRPRTSDSSVVSANPAALRFDAGNWDRYRTVTLTAKALGSATISHTVSGYGTVTSGPDVAVTVNHDPADPPTVAFASASSSTPESVGARDISVTVSPPAPQPFVLRYRHSGTATRGKDWSAPATVFVPAGASSVAVPVAVVDDDADEPDETVTLELLPSAAYAFEAESAAHTLTIVDNDLPRPKRVTIAAVGAVTEGRPAQFTVTADPRPASPISVTVTVTDTGGYAEPGQTGQRTVTVGTSGTATLSVDTVDDRVDEPDGRVSATVQSATGGYAPGSPRTTAVTVRDDDEPAPDPAVRIAPESSATEGGTVSFTLVASPRPRGGDTIAVRVRVADDPNPGSDFLAPAQERVRTVIIGSTGVATLSVPTAPDSVDEPDGFVTATLLAGSGYRLGTAVQARVQVRDDDSPPLPRIDIAPAAVSVTEGQPARFIVTATPRRHAVVTVRIAGQDSFLEPGEAGTRTVFLGSSGTRTIDVATRDDARDEPHGQVTAEIEPGGGYTVGRRASTVQIRDDDEPPRPAVSIDVSPLSVTEGDTVTVTLTASPPPTQPLSVRIRITDAPGSDFLSPAQQGMRNITIGTNGSGSRVITTAADSVDESNGYISVAVVPGHGYTVAAGPVDVLVLDDDSAPEALMVDVDDAAAPEGEWIVFTLRLNRPAPEEIWFSFRTLFDTDAKRPARLPEDYTTISGGAVFRQGDTTATLAVNTRKDRIRDPNEQFKIHITQTQGPAVHISNPTPTGTIR